MLNSIHRTQSKRRCNKEDGKDKIDNASNKEEIKNLNKEFKDKYNELNAYVDLIFVPLVL